MFIPTPDNDIGEGVRDWINVRVTKENSNEELYLITCTFEHPFYVLNTTPDRIEVFLKEFVVLLKLVKANGYLLKI